MKTVKEWLLEADRDLLEYTYMQYYPPRFNIFLKSDLTGKEARNRIHANFDAYIERLCNLEVKPDIEDDNKEKVFVVSKSFDDFRDIDTSLYYVHDLISEVSNPQSLSYDFVEQAVTLGYKIYESELFLDNVYVSLAEILYEMSVFGYEQEELEGVKQELLSRIRDSKPEDYISGDDLFADLNEEKYWDTKEAYEKEQQLLSDIYNAIHTYESYCSFAELSKASIYLRSHLEDEDGTKSNE